MDKRELVDYRLLNQQLVRARYETPEDVVSALGAVQAQDYPGALWTIGLRIDGATRPDIEASIASRKIVRTWPMRGTLHFVAAVDLRWMLELLTPRVVAAGRGRVRQAGLDDADVSRGTEAIVEALRGDRQLTRGAVYKALEASGISTAGQRGLTLLWLLAQRGVVCFAAHQGRQPAFALLEEWVPRTKRVGRDEALTELARRYFVGHGPATLRDFVWWSGLKVSDAAAGLENAAPHLARETVDGVTYWMPPGLSDASRASRGAYLLQTYDEFIIGYADRSAMISPDIARRTVRGLSVLFFPKLVVEGQVVGTWRRRFEKGEVAVEVDRLARLTPAQDRAVVVAAERHGGFLGMRVRLR